MKVLRVVLAIVIFTPILLFFIDFIDILPDSLSKLLQRQLMPAIFTGAVATIVIYFLLTLIFGRVYCSMICPAGILQDIFNRMACISKKKKNGKMRFHYHKPANWLRYVILGITAILAIFGITELCLLLDPYSNFGRIASNIFRPAAIWVNNIIAGILSSKGNYLLYNVSINIPAAALISAIIAFLTFAIMVYFRGRLFCNTICPVGALLSIVSRHSLFRISIDENTCNKCKSCERTCKAEAIDSKNMKVDMSNCVTCFNCTSSCNRNAIKYRFAPKAAFKKNNSTVASEVKAELMEQEISKNKFTESRRSFITTSAVVAGSVPLFVLAQKNNEDSTTGNRVPVTPPGSLSIERFKDLCTGCHICVVQCPTQILKPAGLGFGLGYMLKPHMSYEKNYCNYSCTVCSDVCPTDAIKPITAEEKKVTQIGIANFYIDKCIVKTEKKDCGACSEHCPSQAVHMIPYEGTLTIPKVEPELCVGCGGCESICPVRPDRAIVVIANATHQTAQLPHEEEARDIEVDDFGF
ncbi:MAG: 4Fe-4S binding protein [Tannerella sp.]|nr:4Fe-4S binding protein [Tannerella sp.]